MKIIVIGSGYVGLVTAACFSEVGLDVWCMDTDAAKVAKLNAGGCPIYEPALPELLARNAAAGRLHFTTSLEACLDGADAAFIAVGPPEGEDGSADLTYVCNAARSVGQLMKGDLVVVVKSTVPVGTCAKVEAILREELDAPGLRQGLERVQYFGSVCLELLDNGSCQRERAAEFALVLLYEFEKQRVHRQIALTCNFLHDCAVGQVVEVVVIFSHVEEPVSLQSPWLMYLKI